MTRPPRTTYFIITRDGVVRQYRSRHRAIGMEAVLDGWLAEVEYGCVYCPTIPVRLLGQLFRRAWGTPADPSVFLRRTSALEQMPGVLEALAIPGEAPAPVDPNTFPIPEVPVMAAKKGSAKKAAKKGAKTAKAERKVRTSPYAGMKIVKLVTKNPRKAGTSGASSWDVIRNGMKYEEYIKAGGKRRDLEWDVDHEWAKLEKSA